MTIAEEQPKISLIIPVRNESLRIRQCIEGIRSQTIRVHEIIVIDSGSTDGTLEILAEFPDVTVIHIEPATFNHGLTRNLGVERSSGDYCLLTVGDAYAYDKHWIQHLLNGFTDEDVQAVCGQQVVDHLPENNPLQWFRPQSEPEIKRFQFSKMEWERLKPLERKKAIGWDDVNAMYKRSALIAQPFEKTSYSEDAAWAFTALKAGKAIVFNYKGRVYHYHNETADFRFKRDLTAHYFRYKLTEYIPPVPSNLTIRRMAKMLYQLYWKWGGSWNECQRWMRYNISLLKASQNAAKAFVQHVQMGEEALDGYHAELCGKPPIPSRASHEPARSHSDASLLPRQAYMMWIAKFQNSP